MKKFLFIIAALALASITTAQTSNTLHRSSICGDMVSYQINKNDITVVIFPQTSEFIQQCDTGVFVKAFWVTSTGGSMGVKHKAWYKIVSVKRNECSGQVTVVLAPMPNAAQKVFPGLEASGFTIDFIKS